MLYLKITITLALIVCLLRLIELAAPHNAWVARWVPTLGGLFIFLTVLSALVYAWML